MSGISGQPLFPLVHLNEDVGDVAGNRLVAFPKQPCSVVLGRLDCLDFPPDLDLDSAVGGLVDQALICK